MGELSKDMIKGNRLTDACGQGDEGKVRASLSD
jgi:hypothetical protein